MIGCLTETTTCVVAKPLVFIIVIVRQKTSHTLKATSGYCNIQDVVVANAAKDHFNFAVVQLLVKNNLVGFYASAILS